MDGDKTEKEEVTVVERDATATKLLVYSYYVF